MSCDQLGVKCRTFEFFSTASPPSCILNFIEALAPFAALHQWKCWWSSWPAQREAQGLVTVKYLKFFGACAIQKRVIFQICRNVPKLFGKAMFLHQNMYWKDLRHGIFGGQKALFTLKDIGRILKPDLKPVSSTMYCLSLSSHRNTWKFGTALQDHHCTSVSVLYLLKYSMPILSCIQFIKASGLKVAFNIVVLLEWTEGMSGTGTV